MMTRSLQALYRVVAFVVVGVACAPPPEEVSDAGIVDAGASYADLQLTRLDSSPVWLTALDSRPLRVQVTNLQAEPVADVPIEWSFVPAPTSNARLDGALITELDGTATATITMGQVPERLTVRASLPNGGPFVEWEVRTSELILRAIAQLPVLVPTDAPANLHVIGEVAPGTTVMLPVKALHKMDALEVPVPNQQVNFQVYKGVTGTALSGESNPGYGQVTTKGDGTALVPLQVGNTTGEVNVVATLDGAPPVTFELTVAAP